MTFSHVAVRRPEGTLASTTQASVALSASREARRFRRRDVAAHRLRIQPHLPRDRLLRLASEPQQQHFLDLDHADLPVRHPAFRPGRNGRAEAW